MMRAAVGQLRREETAAIAELLMHGRHLAALLELLRTDEAIPLDWRKLAGRELATYDAAAARYLQTSGDRSNRQQRR